MKPQPLDFLFVRNRSAVGRLIQTAQTIACAGGYYNHVAPYVSDTATFEITTPRTEVQDDLWYQEAIRRGYIEAADIWRIKTDLLPKDQFERDTCIANAIQKTKMRFPPGQRYGKSTLATGGLFTGGGPICSQVAAFAIEAAVQWNSPGARLPALNWKKKHEGKTRPPTKFVWVTTLWKSGWLEKIGPRFEVK